MRCPDLERASLIRNGRESVCLVLINVFSSIAGRDENSYQRILLLFTVTHPARNNLAECHDLGSKLYGIPLI